jgi:hypothetical protein
MFPLLLRGSGPRRVGDYRTLDEGLREGVVEITEVSEQGSVPELRVVNRGPHPVLIVDGEELVGAKQNRVVNLTILVAPQSTLTIPVSCVEAGRWRARSRSFASAPRTQYASGRAERMAQVTRSIVADRGHYSDQSQVWSDIADKFAQLRATSPTGAMEALFEQHAPFIDSCVAACGPVEGQIGALFAVNNSILGFDLFDAPETLTTLLPKLVRSVAVDALDHPGAGAFSRVADPQQRSVTFSTGLFLAAVTGAPSSVTPGVGLGEDFRLTGPGVTGAALVYDSRVIHLSAFALA